MTCQHPRRTPVEVRITLSKTIFNRHICSVADFTAAASASICQTEDLLKEYIKEKGQSNTITDTEGNLPHHQ